MKIMRLISAVSAAGALSLALVGSAVADSATVNLTGPNSNQSISVDNKTTESSVNNNTVTSINVNEQAAASGNTSAKNNTTVGGLTSGGVTNQSTANNSVVINNSGSAPVVTGGQGSLVLPTSSSCSNCGGSGAVSVPSGGRGGVLGASTAPSGGMGAAILPVTGPIEPVDVSALRAAWHPSVTPENPAAVKSEQAISMGMLVAAAVLSLIGAVLTAVRAQQKQRKNVRRA